MIEAMNPQETAALEKEVGELAEQVGGWAGASGWGGQGGQAGQAG
jgi:hypothetical protein